MIAHLEAENAWADERTAHLEPLRSAIFEEIRSRTQETDLQRARGATTAGGTTPGRSRDGSTPPSAGVRVVPGQGRPMPEPGVTPEGEQVLLDGNVEAEGQEFFSLGAFEVDHGGTRVAYAVDVEGDERFALRIKDIDSGAILDDAVSDIGYGVVWSLDGRYVFFTRLDDSWRPFQVWRHEVGTPAEGDVLVFEETDPRFWTGLGSSRDDRFILIASGSKLTTEIRLLDAATPLEAPRVVAPRREGVEYDVEPAGDRLLITHNTDNPDFDIAQAPLDATSADQWTPFVPSRPGERIVDVEAFAGHVVVSPAAGRARPPCGCCRATPRRAGSDPPAS